MIRTCVHIRRTDFVGTGFHVPKKDFIINAMKFVEEKENILLNMNYTTVFFTDDADYVKTLLSEKFEFKDGTVKPVEKFNPDDYYPPHWTPVKYGGPGNAAVIESLK
ncbi:hypothetical protein B9Z55_018086 [Caenorhabditis nigoni]|uniref:Uncharacterized protein n=1 Tax=Caenorhabditis nigoni TaxID=1611254 RepID=A0A2G5TCI3_9PELO|nr:hypothetical protein B9Z55_018086 [Caenorhabditis nigoni]